VRWPCSSCPRLPNRWTKRDSSSTGSKCRATDRQPDILPLFRRRRTSARSKRSSGRATPAGLTPAHSDPLATGTLAGHLGQALEQRTAIFDDPPRTGLDRALTAGALPASSGMISVPVIEGGVGRMLLGVGNKTAYSEQEIRDRPPDRPGHLANRQSTSRRSRRSDWLPRSSRRALQVSVSPMPTSESSRPTRR
jgi:hypothetical protein